MNRNFPQALSLVLHHEGGFVHHPRDPGGATNKGVTLATFRRYVKPGGTIDDLKHLSTDQAGVVYRRQYWDAVLGAQLPSGIDYAVFDFAVNSGPNRAAKYLQRILAVPQDGKIGPKTLAAARRAEPDNVINRLCDDRLAFMKRLKTWNTFGKGWSRRVAGVRSEALKMADIADDKPVKTIPALWATNAQITAPVSLKPNTDYPPQIRPDTGGLWASIRAWFSKRF